MQDSTEEPAANIQEIYRQYQTLFEQTAVGIANVRPNGNFVAVNKKLCAMLGFSREELLQRNFQDLTYTDKLNADSKQLVRMLRGEITTYTTEKRCICKNGTLVWVHLSVSLAYLPSGEPDYFVFILQHINYYKQMEAMLKLRLRLSDLVHQRTQHSVDILIQTAVDEAEALTQSRIGFFHLVENNQETIRLQIWSTNTLQTFCSAIGERQHYPVTEAGIWADCVRQRRPVIHDNYADLPQKKGLPEGHPEVTRELTVPVIRNGLVVAVLGVGNRIVAYTEEHTRLVQEVADLAFDYIERKSTEDRIAFMAHYDALTSLPNRVLLLDRVRQAIAQTERTGSTFVLAYIDLDGFKPVNDRYGHAVGDQFLQDFAQRMTKALRAGDTMARLGGDEFALVLPGLMQSHEGETILWRLLSVLEQPFCVAAHEIKVGASIGFTIYPLDKTNPENLLHHADQAMYQAKWHGKNTIRLYDMVQNTRLLIYQETIEELRQALIGDELTLEYQPQVLLANGEIVGVEALVRWNHPKRGTLNTHEFLPSLEDAPEAVRLDAWVLHHAITQIAAWEAKGSTHQVGININPNSLCNHGFLQLIQEQAAQWPASVISQLEIEILAPTTTSNIEQLTKIMRRCIALGIRFSLDDYALPTTNWNQISKLPMHRLKLDPQFVLNSLKGIEHLKLLEQAIRFAKKFELPVIAQGIENMNLAALLIDLGCCVGQGSGLAQPMAAKLLPEWCRAWPLDARCRDLRHLDPQGLKNALLQVAIRSIQRWSDDLTKFIESNGQANCPMLCTDQCPLTNWHSNLGLFRYGDRPSFAFQEARHRALHATAAELAGFIERGLPEQARLGLVKFHAQRDEFINMIERLAAQDDDLSGDTNVQP